MSRRDPPDPPPPADAWPPEESADRFIRSERFALLVLMVVEHLATRYPRMDFSVAAGTFFEWIDRRVASDPGFFGSGRFPSERSFSSYVHQAVWNAGRLADRQRRRERRGRFEPFPARVDLVSNELGPEYLAVLHDCIDRLSDLEREVFERLTQGEWPDGTDDRAGYIASVLRCSHDDLAAAFESASEKVMDCLGLKDQRGPRRRKGGGRARR
ncbi:MAG: hypothetical protein HRU70_02995 [Phycisphaeraceae bacterium]|nr:MAG: hypothetical protein HRU70_02995 [Phycisphaeraceae bacterium]